MFLRSVLISAVLCTPLPVAAGADENVATVEGIYAAFGAGDVPAILAQLSDDVVWDEDHAGTVVPFLTPRHGRDQVVGFFESLGLLEFNDFRVDALLADDARVAALVFVDVTVKGTGKRVAEHEVHLWTFGGDGKVAHFRHFADSEEYAAALAN